jgi:hypothetical protein
MSFIIRNTVKSSDEANIGIFIVTSSLKINRKILILMRKTILKYQYFSTFLKQEVSVLVFENQNTKYNYQYTDTWKVY